MKETISFTRSITRYSYPSTDKVVKQTSDSDVIFDINISRSEGKLPPSPGRPGKIWFNNRGKSIILTGHKAGSQVRESVSGLKVLYDVVRRDSYNRIIWDEINSYGNLPALNPPEMLSIPDLDARVNVLEADAHNQALAAANSSEWDLSTFFAEAPETVAYIGGRLNDAYNALRKLGAPKRHTGRPKLRNKDRIGDRTGNWMEYRYAISPMAYDIQDASAALAFQTRYFRTARGSAHDSIDNDREENMNNGIKKVINQQWSIRCMSAVYSIFSAEQERKLQTQLWLPQTAWELVKLSFVIDWFIGIGDVINALRPVTYQQRAATDSIKIVYQSTASYDVSGCTLGNASNSEGLNHRVLGPNAAINYKDSYVRSLSSTNLILPPIRAQLNWKRCVDGFSLAWPTLRRGFIQMRKWFA